MDCSVPGSSVLHCLLECVQIHVHWVGDAVQPSHPLPPPSPFAFSLSQHHGLFQWVGLFASGGQSIGASTSVTILPMNIQSWFTFGLANLIPLQSSGFSRVFSNTTIQKHQFFSAQPSLWSSSHIHTWLLEKNIALTIWNFVGKMMPLVFNMQSRFIIAFFPRSKHLLILWL